MDLLDKAKILYRLDYLTSYTTGLERILICLVSKSILEVEDKEIIENQSTTSGKLEKLYIVVTRKGPDAFKQLLDTLISTGNKHLVQLLMQDLSEDERTRLNSDQELRNQIWFDIYEPNEYFCGRTDELQQLLDYSLEHRKLAGGFKNITLIAGLGGIGKTELARAFAYNFYRNPPYGHCIWIHGEKDSELSSGFKRLAGTKGVGVSLVDGSGKERRLSDLVNDIFTNLGSKESCLIIDNVEEYKDLLQEVIEATTKLSPGLIRPFIVLTTRNKKLLAKANLILLEELSEEAGIEFIQKSLESGNGNTQFEPNLALELGNKFQFFPLALVQAVSYIAVQNELSLDVNNTNFGIQDYLNLYESQRASLLNYFPTIKQVHSYKQATFLTWNITLDEIRQNPSLGSVAETLLKIISFFSPDSIQVEFLRHAFSSFMVEFSNQRLNSDVEKSNILITKSDDSASKDSKAAMGQQSPSIENVNDALHLINRYSMFHLSRGEIRIHRLVQEVIRLTLSDELIHQYLDILLHVFDTSGETERRRTGLPYDVENVTHIKSIWFHSTLIESAQLVRKYFRIPEYIFRVLNCTFHYEEAYLFSIDALNVCASKLGSNHPSTLGMEHNLGIALYFRGEYHISLETLKNVIEKKIKIYGNKTLNTAETRQVYGFVLSKVGNYEESLAEYSAVHIVKSTQHGPTNPSTLMVKNYIGLILNGQQKFKEALEVLTEVYNLQCEQLGVLHPAVLAIRNNIGSALQGLYGHNETLRLHQYVYEMRKIVGEPYHHEAIYAQLGMVENFANLGQYQDALGVVEEITKTAEQVLGPTDITTFKYKNLLGICLIKVGKFDQAVKIFESVLKSNIPTGIMDNMLKLTILQNLAFVLSKTNKSYEALVILTNACQEILESEEFYHHTSYTLSVKGDIAYTLSNMGNHNEALELYKEVYEGQLNSHDEMHPKTLSSKHNMGVAILKIGNLEDGFKILKDIWLAKKIIYGESHSVTLKYFEELKRLNITPREE